ncbi:MAG: hypothetical protein LW630_07280 [Saprospiraceae bacterium]|jgi:omega-amidase|nr:hypothetical protein [Saprospiraceae bacterium]
MDKLRVAVFQFSTVWMQQDTNLKKVSLIADSLQGHADILFLPEMFNTGYNMHPESIPPDWQKQCIETLKDIATKTEIWIGGSIPFQSMGRWKNTMVVINSDGIVSQYDKTHLFSPAGEKEHYHAGASFEYFKVGEWCIRPLICYDLRFPYASFQSPAPDILVYSANWPATRIKHWHALLCARAIENQCYVVGVNRTGEDYNGYNYPGESTIISFSGETIFCGKEKEEMTIAALDLAALKEYRQKLPFLSDRRIIG